MSSICAGIVSYNPDIDRLKENIDAIINQVEKVYIVDNGSDNIVDIRKLINAYHDAALIENGDNLGIAKALNEACQTAEAEGYDWIMTLDQDTVCPDDIIQTMTEYISEKRGIICPAVYYEGVEKSLAGVNEYDEIKACMTSGSLTNIKAWNKVNGFREDYFIDFVDNEFCMKLKLAGYSIIRVNACVMQHRLGENDSANKTRNYHKPWRLYYMIRNNYAFIQEYRAQLNVTKEYLKILYIALDEFTKAQNKTEAFRNIMRGYSDARHGVTGKMK